MIYGCFQGPEDIEKIHILEDKNVTDKYGEKCKNGLIEIFLKKKR